MDTNVTGVEAEHFGAAKDILKTFPNWHEATIQHESFDKITYTMPRENEMGFYVFGTMNDTPLKIWDK